MHILLEKYFSFIQKFLPKQSEDVYTSVGLDVGASTCRFVELAQTPEGFSVVGWGEQSTKASDVVGSVRDLIAQMEVPSDNIFTSVQGKGTLIRYISMPKMSADEARESFAIESEKYFPFSQEQIFTDCFVVDENAGDDTIGIMAAASKKEIVNERIDMFNELDIKPDYIGINSVALANAVSVLGTGYEISDDAAIGILDMGDTISSLTILHKNVPQFSRDIYVGGHELTKRIGNSFGVEYNEAVALKIEPGDRLEDIKNACESPLSNIMQEIRLSFDYFQSEKNVEVTHLIVTGGSAKLEGLMEMFRQNLEIEVNLWDPSKLLNVADNVNKEDFEKNIATMGVAIGLALYHYDD